MALGISWIGLQRELETLPKEALVQKFKQGDPRYPQVLIGTVLQGVVDMENRFALAEGQKKGDAAPPDVMTQLLAAVERGIPSVDRGAGEQVPANRLAALQGGIAAPPPAQAQAGPGAPMMAAHGGLIPGYQAGRTVQEPNPGQYPYLDDRTVEELKRLSNSIRAARSVGSDKGFSPAANVRLDQLLQKVDSLIAEREGQDALWELIAQRGDSRETVPYSFDPEGTGGTDAELDALWELIAQHGDPRETVNQLMEGVETSIPTPGGSMYDDLAKLFLPGTSERPPEGASLEEQARHWAGVGARGRVTPSQGREATELINELADIVPSTVEYEGFEPTSFEDIMAGRSGATVSEDAIAQRPSAADIYQAWLGGGTSQLPGAEGGIATRGEEGELDPYSAMAESFTSELGSQRPSAADTYQAWLEGGTPRLPGAYGVDEPTDILPSTVPSTVEYEGFEPPGFEKIMSGLLSELTDTVPSTVDTSVAAGALEGIERERRLEAGTSFDPYSAISAMVERFTSEFGPLRQEEGAGDVNNISIKQGEGAGDVNNIPTIASFLNLDLDALPPGPPGSGRDKRYSEMEDKLERLLNFDIDASGPRELTPEEIAYQTLRGEMAQDAFDRAEGIHKIEQENIRDSIAELPTADQRQLALDSIAWTGIGQLLSQGPRAMSTGMSLLADKMRNWGANEEATKILRMDSVREERLASQRNLDTAQGVLDNVGLLMSREAATRGPQAARAAIPYFLNLWLREATEWGIQERHRQDLLLAVAGGGAGEGTTSTEELGKLVDMVDAWETSLASSNNPFTGEELSDDEVQSVRRVLLQIREILRIKSLGGAIGVDPMTLMEEMRNVPPGADMGFDYLRLLQESRVPATPN